MSRDKHDKVEQLVRDLQLTHPDLHAIVQNVRGRGVYVVDAAGKANLRPIELLQNAGAEAVVMSCGSCRLNFMEGDEVEQSGLHIESLIELVAAQLPGLPVP